MDRPALSSVFRLFPEASVDVTITVPRAASQLVPVVSVNVDGSVLRATALPMMTVTVISAVVARRQVGSEHPTWLA